LFSTPLPLKAGTAGYLFCFCFLFIYFKTNVNDSIPVRPIISKSMGHIFAKFSESVELLLSITSLKLVFGPSWDVAVATKFCWFYLQNIRWTQAASGAAGRANVGFCHVARVKPEPVQAWRTYENPHLYIQGAIELVLSLTLTC